MAAALEPLPPAHFYGRDLPRPRLYQDVKYSSHRVDEPPPVNEGLLEWASKASWRKGGLDTRKHRSRGRSEGRVEKPKQTGEKKAKRVREVEGSKKAQLKQQREGEWEDDEEEEEDLSSDEALLLEMKGEESDEEDVDVDDENEDVEELSEVEVERANKAPDVNESLHGRAAKGRRNKEEVLTEAEDVRKPQHSEEVIDKAARAPKKAQRGGRPKPASDPEPEIVPLSPPVMLGEDVGEEVLEAGVNSSPGSIVSPLTSPSRRSPRKTHKSSSKKTCSPSKKGGSSPDLELAVTPAEGVLSVARPSSKASPLSGRGGSIGKTPVTTRIVSPGRVESPTGAVGPRIRPRRLQTRLDAAAEGVGSTGEAAALQSSARVTRSTAGSPSGQGGVVGPTRSNNRVRRRLV